MATRDGRNPNTPTIPLTPVKSDAEFQRDLMKSFQDIEPDKENQSIRESLEKILKVYTEQLEILTKQREEKKKLQELEKASVHEQQQYYKDQVEILDIRRKAFKSQLDELEAKKLEVGLSKEEALTLESVRQLHADTRKQEAKYLLESRKIAQERVHQHQELLEKYKLEGQMTDRLSLKQKLQVETEVKKKKLKEDQAKLIEEINQKEKEGELSFEEAERERQAVEVKFGVELEKIGLPLKALETISKTVNKIFNSLESGITAAARDREQYQGKVTARLQGLQGVDFNTLASNAVDRFSDSALVSQSKYLSSVASLTDKGIAYNLENRALIETIGDKLVSTFDATNQTLLRLTRIQQADLTVSQLGAEAQLTQFLNARYQDTSYLTDVYGSVSDALLGAASMMSVDQATSFMYDVQKWLGSLYSLGVSSAGVQSIAQGLGYLGTGNVSALSSNAPLQTLIVQSLTKAGYNYADVLNTGLNSDVTNNLLKAMVENLQSIANNTSSKVLKSAWGNIIGLDTTDLRAITNLTSQDIVSIASSRTNYVTAINEAQNQLNQLDARTFKSEQLDNFINNTLYGVGSTLASSTQDYLNYRLSSAIQDITGVSSGSGFLSSLANSGLNMLKLGAITNAFGKSAGGNFWTGIGELFDYAVNAADRGLNLISGGPQTEAWMNWSQYTSRGDIIQAMPAASGISTGLSYSGVMTQYGNEADTTSFASQQEMVAASFETISDATASIVRDASDIYHELFEAQTTPIRVKLADIEDEAATKLLINGKENYPVDVIDSDINAIGQVLKTLPLVRTDNW